MKTVFRMAAAAVLAMGLSAQAQAEKVRIQVYPGNITSLYAYLGVNKGFYQKQGLDVELVNISTGPQANAALASGSVDLVMTTPDNMLLFKARGFDPVAVTGNAKEPVMRLVGRKQVDVPEGAGYREVMAAMKGKTLGVYGLGSAAHRYISLIARDAGLAEGDIRYTAVSNGGQSTAGLMTGQMDAVTEVFATGIAVEQLGLGRVLLDCARQDCPEWARSTGQMAQAWWTTHKYLESHPQQIAQVQSAHREVDAWLRDPAHLQELTDTLKAVYEAPAGTQPDAFFAAVAQRVPGYFSVATNAQALKETQDIMLSTGELKKPVELAPMIMPGTGD